MTIITKPSGYSSARRALLKALPALAFAPTLLAQSGPRPIAVRKLHSFGLRVSDVERSVAFYQAVFGAPIQARRGDTVCLRIGAGPRFFSLSPLGPGEQPGFTHIGLSVADFEIEAVRDQLQAFGISRGDAALANASGLARAQRSWVESRGTTRELYFADLEGLTYQLSSENYCGGGGPLGTVCETPQAAPMAGMFSLVDISHFTNFLANSGRANAFYTRAFGKTFQAYQGPTSPIVGVGDGLQFLMYVGGSAEGAPTQAGRIDHVCFSIAEFAVDEIRSRLDDYGLSRRDSGNGAPPLSHWVSLRMPNRGGIEGGTPEVYFADPDGIHIQVQDPAYCGGGGYLGDDCAPLA